MALAGTLISSKPITFGNGQFAYWLPGDDLTRDMIVDISKINRPPLFRILQVMDVQQGIVAYYEALKIVGSPLDNTNSKTDTLDKILKELEALHLVEVCVDAHSIKYIVDINMHGQVAAIMATHRANMLTDTIFIPDILRSLKSYNLISNAQTLFRNKTSPSIGVIHNNFIWDAIGYTKTTGINPDIAAQATEAEKQTAVVMDIVIHRPYTAHDLNGFYARIQSILHSVNHGTRKVLPIVVYVSIDAKKTYNTLHKLGFLTFLYFAAIYGTRIFQVVSAINQLKLTAQVEFEGGRTLKLIENTLNCVRDAGLESNLKSIKGDLFESMMFPVIAASFRTLLSNRKRG